jgi:transposase
MDEARPSSSPSPSAIPTVAFPDDLEALKQLVRELHEALHRSQRKIETLEHRLQQLLKARFGPRADRLNPNQLLLFATEIIEKASEPAPAEVGTGKTRSNRNGHGRRKLPADLPRKQVVHDLSEEEKHCPCCGAMRERIGQETSEQLEFEPATLYVIEHVRPTYACRACEAKAAEGGPQITTAGKPPQPIEKGLAGPGLLAQVITSKYGDHLPLYRQEGIYGRSGHSIPRSTTCGWMASCAGLVRPLVERMKALVLQSKVIGTDDTPVPVLDPKRGKTRTGRLWVYVGDPDYPYTVFDYTPTRSRDGPVNFFGPYAGYIQADAYGGYDALFQPKADGAPSPTEVGCWAHARRKFVDGQDSDPLRAHTAVAMIRLLYDVEAEARELDAAARLALRREKSVPRLEQIKTWLEAQRVEVLPKSPMGQAIAYCLSNWAALMRYASDGDLSIDNNAAENALRPVALGRKNWLFAGSDAGGSTGATLMSLVASCKRQGLDPFAYLRDVLTRMPATPINDLDQFLPDRSKSKHRPPTPID